MSNEYTKKKNPLIVILLLSISFFFLFLVLSVFFWIKGAPFKSITHTSGSSMSGGSFLTKFGDRKTKDNSIGILEINDVIMDSKKTLKHLKSFEKDENVKGVVVRLNSPGGSVAPSQEIYEAVKAFPKPLVASMDSIAASGAYYIACGAKQVFANAGTLTGSIGVIIPFMNLEKLMEWAKVKQYSIKTGKFKDSGATYREMSAEERELFQNLVDDVLAQFRAAVMEGRKMTEAEAVAVSDGRIFTGQQAKNLNLVDNIGTLHDAVNAVAKLAKIEGEPEVVYPNVRDKFSLEYFLTPEEESQSPLERLFSILLGQKVSQSAFKQLSLSPGVYWLWDGF